MKQIAMFIHHEIGGAVVAFYEFMRVLKKHGYAIDLYRFNQAGESFLPLSEQADNTFDYPVRFHPRVSGRMPLLREYVNSFHYWQNLRALDRASEKMAGQINARRYDLAFVHCDQMVKSPHLLKYLRPPTFAYIQEPERVFYDPPSLFYDELDSHKQPESLLLRLQYKWYAPARRLYSGLWKQESERNIKSPGIKVITNSYFSAEAFLRAYDINPEVCYLGIDTERFRHLRQPRQNFVVTVGSLTPNKGHAFLVHALAYVPETLRPRLVVVADVAKPERKRSLFKLAEICGVRIELRERVSESELLNLYATARLFVYGSRLEPFGIAPLEAMATGLPVVAVRSGGVRETVWDNHTGLLADWNPSDFALKVTRLLQDTKTWTAMSEAGPCYIRERWNWERSFDQFEKIVHGAPQP